MKRHRDAIAIDDGAVNPIAIVNALKSVTDELGHGSLKDPAFKLMVYQLGHLCGVLYSYYDYSRDREECENENKLP
jgi:hypothetical protein